MSAAIQQAHPTTVYLFCQNPGLEELHTFLRRLIGLVKFTLKTQLGRAELPRLAAATAQRVETIRWGLAWLEARGDVTLDPLQEDEIQLTTGGAAPDPRRLSSAETTLQALLDETASYRAYYAQAPSEGLF